MRKELSFDFEEDSVKKLKDSAKAKIHFFADKTAKDPLDIFCVKPWGHNK